MLAFIDTNVLIYAVGDDPTESHKRQVARDLLDTTDLALSVQVLSEFVWQSTRPNRGPKLSVDEALDFATEWRRFSVQDLTAGVFDEAIVLLDAHRFNWWDCLIIAAARAQGCDILYTEDLQDDRVIDGLRIVNPFRDL